MACLVAFLTGICGVVAEPFNRCLGERAGALFSKLWDVLVERPIRDRISLWRNSVALVPSLTTALVGADATLSTIRGHLTGDKVDVVGIVGMGGVGKSTLLRSINNDHFLKGAGNFQIVIFVVVSGDGNTLSVQKRIGERLRLSSEMFSDDVAENGRHLFESLSGKRFLLILDDVWGELDITKIGIPLPDNRNGCKIAIATRSSDVFRLFLGTWCRRRERAQEVRVEPLDPDKSWELFSGMIDAEVDLDDPSIRHYAKSLVRRCGGLPLGLVTVGKAMASARSSLLWEEAVARLEDPTYQLEGMEEQVYKSLRLSVDMLEEVTLLPCFLYCSLFPEDYEIPEENLIDYWASEGFLQRDGAVDDVGIRRLRLEGRVVIEKLKTLLMLEHSSNVRYDDELGRPALPCVRMHDMIRDVALILNKRKGHHFLTMDSPVALPTKEAWAKATRVCTINCLKMEKESPLPNGSPCCPNLRTLLMDRLEWLPDVFFGYMCSLVVLDLSNSVLFKSFPTSICLLLELRYLGLRKAEFPSLPKKLGDLSKLRHLDLSRTYHLRRIPHLAISRLTCLQVLDLSPSGYRWLDAEKYNISDGDEDQERQLRLSDLYGMRQLQDVRIYQCEVPLLMFNAVENRVPGSFLSSITRLELVDVPGLTTAHLLSALPTMVNLRDLRLESCQELTGKLILPSNTGGSVQILGQLEYLELSALPLTTINVGGQVYCGQGLGLGGRHGLPLQKLRKLVVSGCNELQDISWVSHLHVIECIELACCDGMQRLLHCDSSSCNKNNNVRSVAILPKLKRLVLWDLPNLMDICHPQHCLPPLECLAVYECPSLKSLPLGQQTKIKEIWCEREWWDGLEWGSHDRDVRRVAELVLHFALNDLA